jgi:glutamate-1-semialdehyde 2,1-aminomutase
MIVAKHSKELFTRAISRIPGGVNSPVRAFRSVGGTPVFIKSGSGSRMKSVDGDVYIDYVGSWGPLILGHAHAAVRAALRQQVSAGTSYGAPTENEVVIADMICEAVPSIEKVRLVNSGTEATMSAIRLARAFTGRNRIIKFDGCYHGHADGLLVKAGSGVATLGLPDSPGVPNEFSGLTISLPYNDAEAVQRALEKYRSEVAAVIVEPVAGNMGVVPPAMGYLQKLRKLTREHGTLLIFDEVMTGFRVAYGGAQERFRIKPDLTCLGKIIGGGLPAAAYGGSRVLMDWIAPQGPVYQAGTLSGNPLAVAAGIATLRELKKAGAYDRLEETSALLEQGLRKAARDAGIEFQLNRVGSMMTLFFAAAPVTNYDAARASNTAKYGSFFHAMLEKKIYLAPSQFEACFVSLAHSHRDIEATIRAATQSLQKKD